MEVSGSVINPSRMGTFTRVIGITRFDRPVYQNANKRYLYFWADDKDWKIGSDYTTAESNIASKSDGNELDAHLVPVGNWSEVKKGGGWQANSAIAVACTTTGTHPTAAENL